MLNKVSGRIQKLGTEVGIRNVMVVLYDVDISGIDDSNASIRGGHESGVDNVYINFLYGGKDTEEDPLIRGQPRGDRLGSVVTNSDGRFSLQFDDEAFRIDDKEQRPDLLLVVVAPDRPLGKTDETAFPTGTPEIQRLLHISLFPARNIGREEEFIIQISEKTLERQNIRTNTDLLPEDFATAVTAPANRKSIIRSALRKEMKLDEKISINRTRTKQADSFANKVSAVPKALRKDGFFVTGKTEVKEVIAKAEEAGLASVSRHTEFDIRQPSARLRLSDAQLEAMGINGEVREALESALSNGETYEVEIDKEMFCATLQERIGGTVLERVSNLLDPEREIRTKRLNQLDNLPDKESPVEPPQEGEIGTNGDNIEESAEEQIKRLVLAQVASLDEQEDELDKIDQTERVLQNLQKLKPPASPADVTAFHDFTHLQIAFPDVWAEAFDDSVYHLIRQMHIEYKEIEEEYSAETETSIFGEDVLDIDPNELLDLEEYTDLMRKLGADLVSVGKASEPPEVVRSFYKTRVAQVTPRAPLPVPRRGGRPVLVVPTRDPTLPPQTILDQNAEQDLLKAWPFLSIEQQDELFEIATSSAASIAVDPPRLAASRRAQTLFDKITSDLNAGGLKSAVDLYQHIEEKEKESDTDDLSREDLIARAQQIIANPSGRVSRMQRLLEDLAHRLSEPHSFRVFQKDSINFGIMTTYRQEWIPGSYQVADLVSTLPLAPGQTQKYSKKESTKKTRSQKENDKYASTIKDERSITSRAVSDIVDKASSATNFQQAVGTQSGGSLFGFNVSATTSTQFQRNQAAESQRVKKDFREAVRKSSQEFKNERSIEVSTESTTNFEFSSVSEISNPNNEITVTYLFYELERQYRVTEHLQRLTPVIMVAQEVPNPSDIDEDWLLAHEWILRRSLLDDSFSNALDYISEGLVADEVNLETRRDAFEMQKTLVEDLSDNVEALSTMQNTLRDTLVQTSEREKMAHVSRNRAKKRRRRSIFKKIFMPIPGIAGKLASGSSSLGLGRRGDDPEALEARREALETRLKFLEGNLEDSRAQLTRANSALENTTEQLTEAVEESFTKRNLVSQLRIHVKDNILHYMQMIWSYEQPDKRFLRLYGNKVRIPVSTHTAKWSFFSYENADQEAIRRLVRARDAETEASGDSLFDVSVRMPPPEQWTENRRLHEIADLDKPLGFKGNYMLFPLKECVYLTDYMMQDYVDDYLGVSDPDPESGIPTDKLLSQAEKIWHNESTTETDKIAIREVIKSRLTSPRLEDELIVVPTGQLFIEALKGEHVLLEDFKHKHRGMDLRKVNEEVRAAQLENLRKVARLVADEPIYDDPDIEKKVVVEGPANVNVVE